MITHKHNIKPFTIWSTSHQISYPQATHLPFSWSHEVLQCAHTGIFAALPARLRSPKHPEIPGGKVCYPWRRCWGKRDCRHSCRLWSYWAATRSQLYLLLRSLDQVFANNSLQLSVYCNIFQVDFYWHCPLLFPVCHEPHDIQEDEDEPEVKGQKKIDTDKVCGKLGNNSCLHRRVYADFLRGRGRDKNGWQCFCSYRGVMFKHKIWILTCLKKTFRILKCSWMHVILSMYPWCLIYIWYKSTPGGVWGHSHFSHTCVGEGSINPELCLRNSRTLPNMWNQKNTL